MSKSALFKRIYVPTKGRIDKQIMLGSVDEETRKLITLVAVPSEALELASKYNVDVIVRPSENMTIGETRHWIMLQNKEREYTVIVDDDMIVKRRIFHLDDPTKFNFAADPQCVIDAISCVCRHMSLSVDKHGRRFGVGGLQYGNRSMFTGADKVKEMTGLYSFLVLNNRIYWHCGGYFKDVALLEDNNVILAQAIRGFPSVAHLDFNLQTKSNQPGGCTNERNQLTQAMAVVALKKKYPDFVQEITVESESWKKGGMGVRREAKISWAKAYKSGRSHS